jgi:molybdopterin converting factor small subunit
MARLRFFGPVREAAGTPVDVIAGETVGDVLAAARERYGARFAEVAVTCRVWVNGEQADSAWSVGDDDEVALLPPVSGG